MTTFLALDVLSGLEGYAHLTMADGVTVLEHYHKWEAYIYGWLKSKAQRGLFRYGSRSRAESCSHFQSVLSFERASKFSTRKFLLRRVFRLSKFPTFGTLRFRLFLSNGN